MPEELLSHYAKTTLRCERCSNEVDNFKDQMIKALANQQIAHHKEVKGLKWDLDSAHRQIRKMKSQWPTDQPGIELKGENEMEWPAHKASMHVTHNDHKNIYQSVAEWCDDNVDWVNWVSDAEKAKAIEMDSVWSIQWYPDTPVGFYVVAASTFEAAIEAALLVEGSEK